MNIMKKIQFFLPLIAMAVLIGGCPYASKFPIDAASVKINPALLGKWEPKSSANDIYLIGKQDDFHYKVERRSKEDGKPAFYVAYCSLVDGETFLNLKNADEENMYYLYKLELNSSNTKITLKSVTGNIDEKFETAAQLKEFIKKYKSLSFFYDKDEDVFIKAD